MTQRHDIYRTITDQIIAAIEAGAGQWRMPWSHAGTPVTRPASALGRRYTGINRLVLWASAEARGFRSGQWATFQQWRQRDACVRKGESGTHVILWKKVERQDDAGDTGDGEEASARFYARAFVVFNRDQVDGAPAEDTPVDRPMDERVAAALAFLENLGVPVIYGPTDAYYRQDIDTVFLPERLSFDSDLDAVATLAHEIAHSSGHRSRLNRETLRDYHKDRAIRAREEMAVELAASYFMADLGLAYSPRPDHASYISSWLACLRHDPRAIFTAAAAAQAAADWMHAQHARAPLAIAA